MGEALDTGTVVVGGPAGGDAALAARFEAVADAILGFRPRAPHHYPNLLGGEASIPFERILATLARGREALDLAVGEGLCVLESRDLLMDLGYSKMIDYAKEELGMAETTARDKARLARELKTRPLLREAVRSGRLSPRHARELFPVARGEAEKAWVALAGSLSVRELHRVVKRARGPAEPGAVGDGASAGAPDAGLAPDDERWTVASLEVHPEDRIVVKEAMGLAEEALGRGAPRWLQVEAMSAEFLSWHAARPSEGEPEAPPRPAAIPAEDLEKALEIESNGWDWLEPVEPLAAPEVRETTAKALDARLKHLVRTREGWDEAFGIAGTTFTRKRLATSLGFANLGQYTKERLGMSRRAFEQRVWLERRMEALPQLRYALSQGELSYEKARLLAGVADFDSVNGWIRRAEGMTCAELERAVAGVEDAQACARGRLQVRMPERSERLLDEALTAAGQAFPRAIDPGDRLAVVAAHFVSTWWPLLWRRRVRAWRAEARGQAWCATPGCTRPWAHRHHVVLASRGGSDHSRNRAPVCAPHHLRGIHGGRLRVSGTAPDRLVWELADGTPFTAGRGGPRRGG